MERGLSRLRWREMGAWKFPHGSSAGATIGPRRCLRVDLIARDSLLTLVSLTRSLTSSPRNHDVQCRPQHLRTIHHGQ